MIRVRGILSAGFAVFLLLTGCGSTREQVAFDPVFLEDMCRDLDGVWAGTGEDTDRRAVGTFVLTLKCEGRTLSAGYEGTTATVMGPRPFRGKAINVRILPHGLTYESLNSSDHLTTYEFSLDRDSLTGTSEGSTEIIWYKLQKRR